MVDRSDERALADTHESLPEAHAEKGDELAPGTIVGGRYRIVRLLGEGGMGAVYEAVQASLERSVALKVLHADLVDDDATLQRFLREARTASLLRHRNIVEVVDFGHDRRRPFLVMELLSGESLQARIDREAPMTPSAAAALLGPVLSAVEFMHASGFVHRDLKPDNVFLATLPGEPEAVARVLDFGIARALVRLDLSLTAAGELLGTPSYMAPEQAAGAEVDAAADQYALGVILYEMLSGQMPHEMSSLNQAIVARATVPATPLSQRVPGVAPAVERVVMRALSIDPASRYASVEALREALLVAVASPAPAPPPEREAPASRPEAVGAPVDSNVARRAPAAATKAALRVWPAVSGAVAALGLALVASRAFTASPRAPAPERPGAVTRPVTSEALSTESVTFTFEFEPDTARIELDEELLGVRRASVTRPRDGHRHQLRVTAPGHVPYTESLVADGSARLSQRLAATDDAGALAAPRALRRQGVAGRILRTFPGGR